MRNIIQWFVDNPIAANLLMVAMILGGWAGSGDVKKEVFPSTTRNFVYVNMTYPGAAPSEVEQQIVVRIEEAIADLVGIFQITSYSNQGSGSVTIEVIDGYDTKEVLSDVKAKVDAINTFPPSALRPVISEGVNRVPLMFFSLFGDVDPTIIKATAYQIRDEMSVLKGISQVQITGLRTDEVSIEITENNLRRYNITFDEVAQAIRQSSLNLPAGTIKTEHGNIQVQTRAQAFNGEDFSDIVVRSNADGSQLKLEDIANIVDGFADEDIEFAYNGEPGLDFRVLISDDPDLFGGTNSAREYLKELEEFLPPGVSVHINYEMRSLFDSRFNLLKDNALGGLALVFIVLMLFLSPGLAAWVVLGIATTFGGAIWLLPYFGVSINMLSMFAFLMVLGIVVDDAIIIGESIHSHQHGGMAGRSGSALGTKIVLKPVVLAVFSTVIFFLPMIDVPTDIEPFTLSIFYVVVLCLFFSLVECLLVLPSHLSHGKAHQQKTIEEASTEPPKNRVKRTFWMLERIRKVTSSQMEHFAKNIYQPTLRKLLEYKFSTFVGFLVAFFIAVALFAGGWVNHSFFPNVPQAFIIANVDLPATSPFSETQRIANHIERVANEMRNDEDLLGKNQDRQFVTEIKKTSTNNNATVFVGLSASEIRSVSAQDVTSRLRELIGPIPEAKNYSLNFTFGGNGADIQLNLNLAANDRATQQSAIDEISRVLGAYTGVTNVRSDFDSERVEVELDLKPYAQTMGVSLRDIANQVRQGFYGEEVQRIPRAKEDVRVMLRYPEEERNSLDTLGEMRVRTSNMTEIPLEEVATIDLVPGFNTIRRVDRRRNITITADVLEGNDANQIVDEMLAKYLPVWKRQYIGLDLSKDGNLRSQAQFGDNFLGNFIKALIAVFALFAIAFRSIFQPFLVLLAIPFGFMGAIFGHLLLGHDISLMSFFGFLACSGVVVNDNLVLLDRINQLRHQGASALDAIVNAGVDRFRPIVLTSLTTFVGLMPILFERSGQAQFLIPMVISLSFGVMLSSGVTLFMVPCTYYGGERLKHHTIRLWHRWVLRNTGELKPAK